MSSLKKVQALKAHAKTLMVDELRARATELNGQRVLSSDEYRELVCLTTELSDRDALHSDS